MLMLLVTGGGCNGEERRSLKNLVESSLVEAASNLETRGGCTAETCVLFTNIYTVFIGDQVALAIFGGFHLSHLIVRVFDYEMGVI